MEKDAFEMEDEEYEAELEEESVRSSESDGKIRTSNALDVDNTSNVSIQSTQTAHNPSIHLSFSPIKVSPSASLLPNTDSLSLKFDEWATQK